MNGNYPEVRTPEPDLQVKFVPALNEWALERFDGGDWKTVATYVGREYAEVAKQVLSRARAALDK